MSESIYMVRLRCTCGASYAIGMVEDETRFASVLVEDQGERRSLVPATLADAEAIAHCGVCDRDVTRVCTEAEIEDVVEVTDGIIGGPDVVLDRVIRPSRFFWGPDFSGERVLPAEHWETVAELAALTVGRSSETK